MPASPPDGVAALLARWKLEAHATTCTLLRFDVGEGDLLALLDLTAAAATDARKHAPLLRDVLRILRGQEEALDPLARGRLFHLSGFVALRVDEDVGRALRDLNRARAELAPLVSPAARAYLARVHDTLGQLLHREGQWEAAQKELGRSLALRRETGDTAGLAITLGNLGRLCLDIGNIASAEAHFLEDLAILDAEEEPGERRDRLRAQLLVHLGDCAAEIGRNDLARERFARALAAAEIAGDRFARAFAAIGLARVTSGARAQEWLDRAEADLDAAAVPEAFAASPRAAIAHLRGRAKLDLGDARGAVPLLERALRDLGADPTRAPVARARVLGTLARAKAALGASAEASEALRAALRLVDATSADLLRDELEQALRGLSRDAWLLHAAGRFVGQRSIELILEDTGRAGFRGRRRDVCVLFSDIRGFTTVAEEAAPDEVVAFLNEFLGQMTRAIERSGGVVDKFIGDAVMALFGLDRADASDAPDESDGTLAVRAALAMREELSRLNGSSSRPKLEVGFGIHRGPVVAGLIGSPQKRSYTVLGDVVNTASRLEGMTKQLGAEILISDAVARVLPEGAFVLRPLGAFLPKGKREPIVVHDVLGEDDGSPEARRHALHANAAANALALLRARDATAAARYRELAARYPAARAGYELVAEFAEGNVVPTWDGVVTLGVK